MANKQIIIRGEEYKKLWEEASTDKEFFDGVSSSNKEKQTENNIMSSFVGLIGEEAAARYIRQDLDEHGKQDSNVYKNGEFLREIQQTGCDGWKHSLPDITICHPDYRETYWEVKTTQKQWPGRQLLRDHAKEYMERGAKGVIFVTVDLSCKGVAICRIDGSYSLDEIWETWKPRKPHAKRKHHTCLTHPDDAHMFRMADISTGRRRRKSISRYYE